LCFQRHVPHEYGAKHYPPGARGPPDCLRGVPPVCMVGPPLTTEISPRSLQYEEISTSIMIIINELSYGVPNVLVRHREPLEYRHHFVKIMKKWSKIDVPKNGSGAFR